MNNILYVTSFNKALFDATGKDMTESFLGTGTEGDLLITYEDGIKEEIPSSDNTLFLDLDSYDFLQGWLKKNQNAIPVKYGGTFEGCNCIKKRRREPRENGHVRRCPNMVFNRRASLWFRKIAAMNHALKLSEERGYSKIVFADSDVIFKNKIAEEFINEVFEGNGFFFHLGKYRKKIGTGIESGFIGFSRENKGFDFLQLVIDKYLTGDYKKYRRWDDGYVFRKVWEEHPEIPSRDVVENNTFLSGDGKSRPVQGHVVKHGLFGSYIKHYKGSHVKKYKLFKRI